jgi:hypothetical protein
MQIAYSDFEKKESTEKLRNLDFNLRDLVKCKTDKSEGFVLAKTRNMRDLNILRWEFALSADHIGSVSSVRDEPNSVTNALREAVEEHNPSAEMVVDFRFYMDVRQNPSVDWPNQHVIAICDWQPHADVLDGQDIVDTLRWAAESS